MPDRAADRVDGAATGEAAVMDAGGIREPVDTLLAIGHAPGARPVYRIADFGRGRLFAAKWSFDRTSLATGNLSHSILACRTSGTATVVRRSAGTTLRRRPKIGAVTYVSPEAPAHWATDGPCEVCHVYLTGEALRRFSELELTGASVPTIRDLFAVEDPWLKGYFQMLASEFELVAQGGQAADSLFISQAEQLLIGHLLRCHSDTAPKDLMLLQPPRRPNPLPAAMLGRVQEYIAEHLGGDIALPDLAAVACMSTGHFLRSFRAASGTTPYHHVLEQRLRKARFLLQTTTLPVSSVALACGFKTSAHLASKFHASFGASPSRYRARMRTESAAQRLCDPDFPDDRAG